VGGRVSDRIVNIYRLSGQWIQVGVKII